MMTKAVKKYLDFSIVVPVYYNEGLLETTFKDVKREVFDCQAGRTGEIIFVDDGSGDNSLQELLCLQKQYPQWIRVIKFTRNFGQVSAWRAGLAATRGKCAIVISADGQDPPALINDMLKAFYDENYEVVVCSRSGRDESYFRILTSQFFYRLIKKLSFPNIPSGGFDYLLLGRRALDVMNRTREAQPFFQGQILWMGFPVKFIKYFRLERKHGKSRWTLAKKITYLIDGLIAYSFLPIRMVSVMGLIIALFGFLYAAIVLFARIFLGNSVKGWAPLMIVFLVLGGFQMLTMGVFGEYMWRILAQVRMREPYIIDNIWDETEKGPATDVESV